MSAPSSTSTSDVADVIAARLDGGASLNSWNDGADFRVTNPGGGGMLRLRDASVSAAA